MVTRKEAKKLYNNNLNRKKVKENGRLSNYSSGKPKLGYNTQLQGSWVWNEKVTELIKKYVKGYSLNCPAGLSEIGDIKGDLEPQVANVGSGARRVGSRGGA